MKVLVIGGTNFIGPHVVRYLLASGHSVMIFHRGKTITSFEGKVDFLRGDRQNLQDFRSQIAEFAPDVVVDTIAYTKTDAQIVVNTIRNICSRVVVISSEDVYLARDIIWGLEKGEPNPTPLTEESPLRSQYYPYRHGGSPNFPPDYDKILVEQTYLQASHLQTVILRLPMVYGPKDPLHRFAAYLHRMERDRPGIVLEETLANWRSSYGYVENIAWGITLAVNYPQAENYIFNISEAEPLSEQERLNLVGNCLGWKGKIVTVNSQQLPDSYQLPFNLKQDWVIDSTRIRQVLGYQEPVSRTEAMQTTLAWQRSHFPTDISQSASAIALLDEAIEDSLIQTFFGF